MSKTITLTDTSLKEIIRMAVKIGGMNLGAKQDRLVKAVFEEAEEKSEDVIIRMPIKFDISTEGLELIMPKADPAPNCNCHGGCGVEDCPGYGEAEESADDGKFVSYEEARRRKVVAEMHLAELALYEKAPGLL
ncbi:hypothetical protein [Sagittula sp. MA-2]|jgi:hypothetical protein|uniref:hypothetical protein n=1 Tax=Sagittula sp. MA-2 TaxID=3048007 RepID=UPI0024C35705|nr:hypothetical protein [Sagittula sp. MA-2]WHZ36524.1 hypothetical protein QNI11_05800 [Sagittula sp. MA-2]